MNSLSDLEKMNPAELDHNDLFKTDTFKSY